MKRLLNEIKIELVQSFKNGELIDYISESAIEMKKDANGDLEEIIFGNGGPYVYLDFVERAGVICGYKSFIDEGSFSAIPLETWKAMRDELEDILGEIK